MECAKLFAFCIIIVGTTGEDQMEKNNHIKLIANESIKPIFPFT